jgi:hypothetical protein
MAQRKKRATLRKRKSTARGKARKASVTRRGKAAKHGVARPKPSKRLAKSTSKRAAAKKSAPKRARQMKRPNTPTVEAVTVDVIEEPAPGVVTITEFEETEVRKEGQGLERPEETPPESEER